MVGFWGPEVWRQVLAGVLGNHRDGEKCLMGRMTQASTESERDFARRAPWRGSCLHLSLREAQTLDMCGGRKAMLGQGPGGLGSRPRHLACPRGFSAGCSFWYQTVA